jgi:DNA-directed RNA polymerase
MSDDCELPGLIERNSLAESRRRTRERFERRNRLVNRRGRPRLFVNTPLGRRVTLDIFLEPLAAEIALQLGGGEYPPPGDLGPVLARLDSHTLALIVLAPLLDSIMRGWQGDDTDSAEMLLRLKIGRYLRDRLDLAPLDVARAVGRQIRRGRKPAWKFARTEWTNAECVAAGHWLLSTALVLDYFASDERGFPIIAPDWQAEIDAVRAELLDREPYMMPHRSRPPDWTGFDARYDDRLGASFVRDWRPETRAAIADKFKGPFPHADAVNALQRVPFRINERVLLLVERFAAAILNDGVRDGARRTADEKRQDNERTVANDVGIAKWLTDALFWLTYNTDRRGRILAIPHFNYGREDHVRGMFRFARGMPIGDYGLQALEVHCAGVHGATHKKPSGERLQWIDDNRRLMERIADDPAGMFDYWRRADKPFAFLAACFELVEAWKDSRRFITTLPIEFDATCSGIQHLALLARDADAARLVNLTGDTERPQDVYGTVADAVMATLLVSDEDDDRRHVRSAMMKAHPRGDHADWWRDRLLKLDSSNRRKLFKRPVMTFAYSATDHGFAEQLVEASLELLGEEPPKGAAMYLARKIRAACHEKLKGPAAVMDHVCKLALAKADRGQFLTWENPSGFSVANDYRKSISRTIYLSHGRHRSELVVADGALQKINRRKIKSAAAPNFVHSLDAAHLARVVNRSVLEGIKDVVTVHDCFACLAPHANRFKEIIFGELGVMYEEDDPLTALHARNAGNTVAPLERGSLDLDKVCSSGFSFI